MDVFYAALQGENTGEVIGIDMTTEQLTETGLEGLETDLSIFELNL